MTRVGDGASSALVSVLEAGSYWHARPQMYTVLLASNERLGAESLLGLLPLDLLRRVAGLLRRERAAVRFAAPPPQELLDGVCCELSADGRHAVVDWRLEEEEDEPYDDGYIPMLCTSVSSNHAVPQNHAFAEFQYLELQFSHVYFGSAVRVHDIVVQCCCTDMFQEGRLHAGKFLPSAIADRDEQEIVVVGRMGDTFEGIQSEESLTGASIAGLQGFLNPLPDVGPHGIAVNLCAAWEWGKHFHLGLLLDMSRGLICVRVNEANGPVVALGPGWQEGVEIAMCGDYPSVEPDQECWEAEIRLPACVPTGMAQTLALNTADSDDSVGAAACSNEKDISTTRNQSQDSSPGRHKRRRTRNSGAA